MRRHIGGCIFGALLGTATMIFASSASANQSACSSYPFGDVKRSNLDDFYFAYRAIERSIQTLSEAIEMDKPLSLTDIITICRAAEMLDRFTVKLPRQNRDAYTSASHAIGDAAYELAEIARGSNPLGPREAIAHAKGDLLELAQHVPHLWLSIASTLHGRLQPGSGL